MLSKYQKSTIKKRVRQVLSAGQTRLSIDNKVEYPHSKNWFEPIVSHSWARRLVTFFDKTFWKKK